MNKENKSDYDLNMNDYSHIYDYNLITLRLITLLQEVAEKELGVGHVRREHGEREEEEGDQRLPHVDAAARRHLFKYRVSKHSRM